MIKRIIAAGLIGGIGLMAAGAADRAAKADWRTASRASIGTAPDPAVTKEAVIQVYAARAWSWRGYFGVHSWISAKRSGADSYQVYEVIGWRARHGGSSVVVSGRTPDGRWFGEEPDLIADKRGAGVDDMIDRLDAAVLTYPHAKEYRVWPGPNSNTFIAHLARAVPELKVDLPPTAIGKDYIPDGGLVARTPSGTGYQFSLFGLLGVMAAVEEGLEVNVLGFTFGLDPFGPAVKLPAVGRLGRD
ncbi:MAG: DUF3750 domain-containing protein [Magnetovibrionaceae bacterium]